MAVSLPRISWWLWGGKEKEPTANGSSLRTASEFGFEYKEPETVKFPLVKGTKLSPSPSKVKRKWQSREKRRIDREYDVVLVPSDGGECLSGSESDDSDWSVGWLEPHGPDFRSDNESDSDNSFAVLVPCYRPSCKEVVENSRNELLGAIKSFPAEISSGKNYMEHWLASIQNFED